MKQCTRVTGGIIGVATEDAVSGSAVSIQVIGTGGFIYNSAFPSERYYASKSLSPEDIKVQVKEWKKLLGVKQ
jgi:hypothetical protein